MNGHQPKALEISSAARMRLQSTIGLRSQARKKTHAAVAKIVTPTRIRCPKRRKKPMGTYLMEYLSLSSLMSCVRVLKDSFR